MIAAVAVFFNPVGYTKTLRNYWRFRENFTKKIPLYVLEASFTGIFATDANFRVKANLNNQVLWQKERMINWVVEHLPDKFNRYVYSDTDVIYPDGWDNAVIESEGIVQSFGRVDFLDSENKVIDSKLSSVKWMQGEGTYGCPGLGWAYPREVKQYELAPVGAGDSLLERALWKKQNSWPKHILTDEEYTYYRHWSQNIKQYEINYIDATVQHLYHGTRENRNYVNRHTILKKHHFNPVVDLQIAKNGLLSWSSYKPQMHKLVKNYFFERKEDE